MMKRTFAAEAVLALALAAAAGTASAADVTLYGTVDTGLVYTHTKTSGESSEKSFEMQSGFGTDSIFGLRGTEELGGGMTVSFTLENSFNSDSGTFGDDDGRLFDKEAQATLSGRFGAVSFGRMGALTSGDGTYNIFTANADSMDGGYGDWVGTGYWLDRGIYDNMITLQSPEFGGFTVFAQYSFGTNSDDDEHSRSKDRYAAVGATFEMGDLTAVLVVDSVLYNRNFDIGNDNVYASGRDDALGVSFGLNYDLGFMKPFFGVQYGKHENNFAGFEAEDGQYADIDGYAVHLGSAFPVMGGELQVRVLYGDGEGDLYNYSGNEFSKFSGDVRKWGVGAFHNYELSARTSLYLGLGYSKQEVKPDDGGKTKEKGFQCGLGITHNF